MRKKKFYYKLFLAYVLIVFVYTVAVSIVFFYKNNQIGQLELKYRQDALLHEVRDKIDTQLNIASNVINQLKINSNVLDYAQKNETDYYVVTKIYSELSKNLDAFSNFGFTIGIGKRNDDLIITPHNTSNKERFYDEIGLEPVHEQEIEASLWDGNFSKSLFLQTNGESGNRRITLVRKEPNIDFLFFISFYESSLLPSMTGDSEGLALIKGNRILAQNGHFDAETLERLLTSPETSSSSTLMMHVLDSKVISDLKYGYITQKLSISPQVKALAMNSFAVYLVFAAVGLLLAMLAANRTYRPIQKTVNQFKSYGLQEDHDELTFIQSAADGIHKLNEDLQETINRYKLPLRKKLLRDVLFGLVPAKKALSELEIGDLRDFSGPVAVAIVEVTAGEEQEEEYSKNDLLGITGRVTALMEQYLSKGQACETFNLDYKRFVVLLAEDDNKKLKQRLTAALREISHSLSIRLVAAMGDAVAHIGDAEGSFQEAMKMMEYRFVMERKALITATDLEHLRSTGYYYPLEMERDLITGVISGNADKTLTVLNKLLVENLDIRKLSIEKRSQFILAIVSTLNRINQQIDRQEPASSISEEKWYPKLMLCSDLQTLKQAIYRLFNDMMNRIQDETGDIEQSIACQTLEYIHEHYDKDISLNDMAKQFNYSNSYISTLFKKHTGDNFRDYLNNYRVKKAKEILDGERGVKIQDLALRVGYSNANTFIRVFKRYEGISPGQYAQNLE